MSQPFNYIHFKKDKPKLRCIVIAMTTGRVDILDCSDVTPASIERLKQWDRSVPIKLWCGFHGIQWRHISKSLKMYTVEKITGTIETYPVTIKKHKNRPTIKDRLAVPTIELF